MPKQNHTEPLIRPFNAVIFGGDGDLAFRKIYPAICHRFIAGQIKDFQVFAVTRSAKKHPVFYDQARTFLQKDITYPVLPEVIEAFLQRIQLVMITDDQPDVGYGQLKQEVQQHPERQTVFYLSTPSDAFQSICQKLKHYGLIHEHSKVVLEKPLGHSLASSKEIHADIIQAFSEDQIYRIDHYLGKETVQNLMILRFANQLFENAWGASCIDRVEITVAEDIGVESRAGYYDQSGALLDMVQNHLLQLLCLIAMEPPINMEANNVRDEKLKVIRSLRLFDEKSVATHTVRGQYTRGEVDGRQVPSYLEDIGKFQSPTETFVAIHASIDNWRWKDVPFYLRTGKRMPGRFSEIIVHFKSVRHNVFNPSEPIEGNKLIIRIQPQEHIELVQMTKLPGPGGYRYKPAGLKLDFIDSFKERLPEAYERLFMDVLRGNQTLFMRQDELEAAWVWTESIAQNWKKTKQKNILYEAGTFGPGQQIFPPRQTWYNTHENTYRTL